MDESEVVEPLLDDLAGRMSALYSATGGCAVVDDDRFSALVERPLSATGAFATSRLREQADANSIDRARRELAGQLAGRMLTTAVVHGNLWLGNVLRTPGTAVVSGVVDWTFATPGIPVVDIVHLACSTRALEQHREIGAVVCELLELDGWPEREARLLERVPGAVEITPRRHPPGVAPAPRRQGEQRVRERRVDDAQRAPGAGARVNATLERLVHVPRSRARGSIALLTIAAALWLVSLIRIDVGAIGSYGLLSAFPITMFVALGVLTVSMGRAVHREETNVVLAAHVVLFLVIAHGTPAALYETLRYSWAWKHIGLVDYLARHHTVDPHVTNLNVYQSWPGFFAVAATWLVGSHASSWLGPAQWAPLFFELLDVLALYAIFTTLESDRRVVWTGIWLFALGNWIGQDYFSPQAFAFFLYLVVVLVVVRWLGRRPAMPRLLERAARPTLAADRDRELELVREPVEPPAHRNAALAVVVLCSAAIASSHPLTPFVLVVGVVLVGLSGALASRRVVVAVAVVVVAWLATGALGYMRAELPSILGGLTSLGGTVDQSLSKSAHASTSQHIVSLMGRIEVLVVVGVALAGSARRIRNGRWDATAITLAAAPLAIVAGGAYGGEAVFRVYFFALPFLAYLAGAFCYPTPGYRSARSAALATVVSIAMMSGFLFGYFGKEQWAHFSLGEMRAAAAVLAAAPPHSLVVDGTGDYPIGFAAFENVTYLHLAAEPPASIAELLAAPEPFLYTWLEDARYAQGFVIITRSEKDEAGALGVLPAGALDRIERALLASSRFVVLYHDADASAFTVVRLTASVARDERSR